MKRIVAIDILRGFALLGILIMNIMSFSLPQIAYFNPSAFGGDEWFNRAAYGLVHIIADQKFMALFSMLFGASVMLVINNLESKGQKPARFHFSRNGWLLVIGLLHGIFIWEGDILTVYALCSFVLYFFRKVSPQWQFTLGLIIFLLPAAAYYAGDAVIQELPAAEVVALEELWRPNQTEMAAEIARNQGNYWPQVLARLNLETVVDSTPALDVYYITFIFEFFTRAFGMMLIGMSFYTWGVVTAQKSDAFYRTMLIGFPVGIGLAAVGLWWNSTAGWPAVYSMFLGRIPNLLATPLIAGSYIALIMLWSRTGVWHNLQDRLAATGRMALTNYIGQSLIGTFIFYGFGLGLFGTVNRLWLFPIMMLIWAFQLWLSPIWLRYFRYGPLEWLWRSLSHWAFQPLRRQPLPLNTKTNESKISTR